MSEVAETQAKIEVLDGAVRRVLGRALREADIEPLTAVLDASGMPGLLEALIDSPEHQTVVAPNRFVPPGHFYSPLPSDAEILEHANHDWSVTSIPGVDLNEAGQLALLEEFAKTYDELPFQEERVEGLRYYYGNPNYSYSDAIFLVSMIRHLQPKRFVEVGSGDSSCALLDANDAFLGGELDITFVEPYPQYLRELLGDEAKGARILEQRLQDVDPAVFSALEAGDVLFIDSTHVSKTGSDVNHLFFEILPALASGVHVHIHDIFWPFEYPNEWLVDGRAWNENYMLRAFLEFNDAYEIAIFGNWAVKTHPAWFEANMPLCLRNAGGSIWLRRK